MKYYTALLGLGAEVTEAASRIFLQSAIADLIVLLASHMQAVSVAQQDTNGMVQILMAELGQTVDVILPDNG